MVDLGPNSFRNVPDWPEPGIQFKDIGPLLRDPSLLSEAAARLIEAARGLGEAPDFVVAPEARGFLFGPGLSVALGAGFIPARKPEKLPPQTRSIAYQLEYGHEHLHIPDTELEGARVLIHDDLLATGGTAAALMQLVRSAGAEPVGAVFLSELSGLGGRAALSDLPVRSVVLFD